MYVNVLVEWDALLNAHRCFQVQPGWVKHTHHAYPLLTQKIRMKTFCSTFKKGSCWLQNYSMYPVWCIHHSGALCSSFSQSHCSHAFILSLYSASIPQIPQLGLCSWARTTGAHCAQTHTRTHCTHTCSCHCSSWLVPQRHFFFFFRISQNWKTRFVKGVKNK